MSTSKILLHKEQSYKTEEFRNEDLTQTRVEDLALIDKPVKQDWIIQCSSIK